jgi:phosphoribulokinase
MRPSVPFGDRLEATEATEGCGSVGSMLESSPRPAAPSVARAPALLAVAGDSASGKTTLSRGIGDILGAGRVRYVCADDYHRYDRADRRVRGVTPLDPRANRMEFLGSHLRALASGRPVTKPTYDHRTGSFGADETVEPAEVVIVEGLLPLADRSTRDAIDVGVFLDPEEMMRRRWKLERDVFDRGYAPGEVVDEIRRREVDAAEHVGPQRDFADVVVAFHRRANAQDDEHLSARLTVRPTVPFPGLRDLVGSLRRRGAEPIRWSTGTDGRGPISVLDIDGDCPPDLGEEIEDVIWSSLRPDDRMRGERIGMVRQPGRGERRSEALALAQLLIVAHLVGMLDGSFDL